MSKYTCVAVSDKVHVVLRQISGALYLLTTACARNYKGQPCTSALFALLTACPTSQTPPSGQQTAVSALFRSDSPCSPGCAEQVADLVSESGCCLGTAAAAAARRAEDIGSNPWLGRRFRVDWGAGQVEEVRAPDACGGGGWVDALCMAGR